MRVLSVFGTRPEAIKMAPVVQALASAPAIEQKVCVTGQHREMLDQVLTLFNINPDFDLNVMESGQTLSGLSAKIIERLQSVFDRWRPDMVLVHGDTTTSFVASFTAFLNKIPVGHVEAGLRTRNLYSPWPEEGNRQLTGVLAELHFAPTASARDNLIREGVESDKIEVTGNTVVDALLEVSSKLDGSKELSEDAKSSYKFLSDADRVVLITGHRRENFGPGFLAICRGIARLAEVHTDVQFIYPVHLNPNVQEPVSRYLSNIANIHLIEPLGYVSFLSLMKRSSIILTDSGGVQEEAPSLGKPVLVMRETTERPEAVDAGTVKLVGTDESLIYEAVTELLTNHGEYERMSRALNPYGDGLAAQRICNRILNHWRL
jgi:UDP-N-acetylglucosamine 2-epimerase (non-hydrolysing)